MWWRDSLCRYYSRWGKKGQQEQRIPTGAGACLWNHGLGNQQFEIQLTVNSVRRETIDIKYEMWENNVTMTRKFRLMNSNIRRIALAPGQWGVANRRDHNQHQLQASMLVGGSLTNAEGEDAELQGYPSLHCHKIYAICGSSRLRGSEWESLQGIPLFWLGLCKVWTIILTTTKCFGIWFPGSHDKATQPILQ